MPSEFLRRPIAVLFLLVNCTISLPLPAQAPPNDRTPIDAATFLQIADYFAYDPDLPLQAKVLDTQLYGSDFPYAVDKVHFRSTYNQVVTGHFAYPRDSTATCAAIVLLHGNNSWQGINHSWVRFWLDTLGQEGFCVLAIDAYGYGERLEPNQNKDMGLYQWRERTIQQAIDSRRAIDYLHTRSQVDTSRIALMGESMGGLIGIRAAGLDTRLAGLVLIVTVAGEFPPAGPFGKFANSLNFAPRISAPVLMLNATQDEYGSTAAAEELYAVLPQPKVLQWHQSGHSIPLAEQRRIILPWLEKHLTPEKDH